MSAALAAAQATGPHWRSALQSCLVDLGPLPGGANLGFVYVNEGFAEDLDGIIDTLRHSTGLTDWVGAVGLGVFGPRGETTEKRGIAVLAASFEPGSFLPFAAAEGDGPSVFATRHADWLESQEGVTAITHANPSSPRVAEMIGELADSCSAFLIGGLVAGSAGSSLSGVLLGDQVELITGLTQGCIPIGPSHIVTAVEEEVVMALDSRPALDVLKEEAGELIARDLRRAAGLIHVALPRPNSDANDYTVRNLIALDPAHGWIAAATKLAEGDRMMFVRRDPNAAQRDMARLVGDLSRRLKGRRIAGGLYISCVGRGANMFGEPGRELTIIHEGLGQFPLIGFAANGEICGDRLFAYTGILTLFLGK